MRKIARFIVFLVAMLLAPGWVHATNSLSFIGGGDWVDMEIGYADEYPVVVSVSFHAPGDAQGVLLRRNVQISRFDITRRELVMIYQGSDPRRSIHLASAWRKSGSPPGQPQHRISLQLADVML